MGYVLGIFLDSTDNGVVGGDEDEAARVDLVDSLGGEVLGRAGKADTLER